jgi:hypothetical protein
MAPEKFTDEAGSRYNKGTIRGSRPVLREPRGEIPRGYSTEVCRTRREFARTEKPLQVDVVLSLHLANIVACKLPGLGKLRHHGLGPPS